MNENEFDVYGVIYVARETDLTTCSECDLDGKCISIDRPNCTASRRDDKRNVIFVEKQP